MVPKVKPVLISSVEKAARRGERIDDVELGQHLGREQHAEESEVGEDGSERNVEPALEEEERGQEGESDDAQPHLLSATTRANADS